MCHHRCKIVERKVDVVIGRAIVKINRPVGGIKDFEQRFDRIKRRSAPGVHKHIAVKFILAITLHIFKGKRKACSIDAHQQISFSGCDPGGFRYQFFLETI